MFLFVESWQQFVGSWQQFVGSWQAVSTCFCFLTVDKQCRCFVCWQLTSSGHVFLFVDSWQQLLAVNKQWTRVFNLFLFLLELCRNFILFIFTFSFLFILALGSCLSAKVFCHSPMLPNTSCPLDNPSTSNNRCWLSHSQIIMSLKTIPYHDQLHQYGSTFGGPWCSNCFWTTNFCNK